MSYYTPRVVHVPAGKGTVKWMSGDVYETMATAESTDESFYLISGSLEFLNGDRLFEANAGDFVFVPRGTRHRFRNNTDEQVHMVSFFTPGGGEGLWLEGGDDPVPGAKPEFWPPERGMALGPLLGRKEIDMEILPEQTDLGGPAAGA
jgi:mannose-6-phosphate isomerase-like protein (cupin superfamily)